MVLDSDSAGDHQAVAAMTRQFDEAPQALLEVPCQVNWAVISIELEVLDVHLAQELVLKQAQDTTQALSTLRSQATVNTLSVVSKAGSQALEAGVVVDITATEENLTLTRHSLVMLISITTLHMEGETLQGDLDTVSAAFLVLPALI